jgi:hypothetical protein
MKNSKACHFSSKQALLRSFFSCLFSLALCLLPHLLAAQPLGFVKRYINKIINDTTDIREPQFIAYPTLVYAPETSWEVGLSTVFVYYAKKDTTNRLSEINGFTFYTFRGQYGAAFEHALYTHQNRWSFLGKIKYQNFPLLYFGIGPNTPSAHEALVEARLLNIKERALKRIGKNIFAGVEIEFQRLSKVEFVPHGQTTVTKPPGHEGSANLGFGAGILYDERHNVLNVRKGAFAELALLHYNKAWGSDFGFTSILSDNRLYKSLNSRNVLALQAYGQFTIGQPPFNQLSLLGGESLMRGYYTGRFRDKNQLAAQAEFRMLPLPLGFTKRWGAAVFGSTGTVFNHFSSLSLNDFVFAGGAGLRFLLFPKKDIYSRVDLAFTKEGTGLYIFIGEAF